MIRLTDLISLFLQEVIMWLMQRMKKQTLGWNSMTVWFLQVSEFPKELTYMCLIFFLVPINELQRKEGYVFFFRYVLFVMLTICVCGNDNQGVY